MEDCATGLPAPAYLSAAHVDKQTYFVYQVKLLFLLFACSS